jgi:glycosyltransferase involved in cell wall biosynthesis
MRIAQIAPLAERVPPTRYGGTERIVSVLTEGLVKRGHKVTLFATGDSQTSAELVSVFPKALRAARIEDPYGTNSWSMLEVGTAYEMRRQFDIIHDHIPLMSLPTANISKVPVVYTVHGVLSPELRRLFQKLSRVHAVSISKAQGKAFPKKIHMGTVYHGLHLQEFPFSATHDGYLLFVGRISLDKGTHHAIKVAQLLDLPLIIAAKLDKHDLTYFHEYVAPYLSDTIQYIGEVDEARRNDLMSKAMCLLHPITFSEPFGLTLIEAMACGCPVIAIARGSIPELVKNRKTGYVVRDVQEMIEAVKRVPRISREQCREYSLTNFSADRMIDEYVAIYNKILSKKV